MDLQEEWFSAERYTPNIGYGLASACKLAYREPRAAERFVRTVWRMKGTALKTGSTEGIVVEAQHAVIVGFRGTDSLSDWLRNIDVGPRRSIALAGSVHSGFLGAYQEISHLVEHALERAQGRRIWFTGHSLGGALALIAAAHSSNRELAGIVTFGQPRMLKTDASAQVQSRFGDIYYRVVNDNDIVARIPPNYVHTGRLIHFNYDGSLRSSGEGMEGGADGPKPLSEAEFHDLQETLERVDDARAFSPEEADRAIEGIIPGVPAHRIDSYVQVMRNEARRRGAPGSSEALSSIGRTPRSRRRMDEDRGYEFNAMPGIDRDADRFPVVLRLNSSEWTAPADVIVQSRFSTFATALVTRASLEALGEDDGVHYIEISRDPSGLMDLDKSVPFVQGDVVHRPPISETGDGALIGVVDSGIDILHDAFLDEIGKTRILAIWDQRTTDPSRTPNAIDGASFSQTYGRVFLSSDIDQFRSDNAAGTPSHPSRLRDPNGHGTHVAGIAAGRKCGSMADGMAPGAGIVMVIASVREKPDDPPSLGYSMSHIDALDFLKKIAEGQTNISSGFKPMVINVSQGMNAGAHDGTTTLETAFDGVTSGGQDPGCVIVKSAGNERGHGGHTKAPAFVGGIMPIEWESSSRYRAEDYFEAWFDGLDDIAFQVVDPGGNKSRQVDFASPASIDLLGGNMVRLTLTEGHKDNGANKLEIIVTADTQPIQMGVWTLEAEGRRIVSDARGVVHVWVERNDDRPVRFRVEDPEMTMSIPGTARSVICVGASDVSTPVRLLGASSWGLTWDGRLKPDLCAPGHAIISAKSGEDATATVACPGTSMAAPHVSGAIALVLSAQVKAGLKLTNARQFQTALAKTVKGLTFGHSVGVGFGVLDTAALFQHLVRHNP